jgi:hypothetical protein
MVMNLVWRTILFFTLSLGSAAIMALPYVA